MQLFATAGDTFSGHPGTLLIAEDLALLDTPMAQGGSHSPVTKDRKRGHDHLLGGTCILERDLGSAQVLAEETWSTGASAKKQSLVGVPNHRASLPVQAPVCPAAAEAPGADDKDLPPGPHCRLTERGHLFAVQEPLPAWRLPPAGPPASGWRSW